MTDKTTANRETLARVAGLVRPALATKDYVPALTHIRFDRGYATAFNDTAAIAVRYDTELGRCVPGELLVRALGSFGGQEVMFQEGKDGSLTLKSGRSTVKLPTLPAGDMVFEFPGQDQGTDMPLGASVLRAVERCLLSVGSDSNHPATLGVTLEEEQGLAVLYSTDNYTVSRCETDAKIKLPGGAPVILPRFFCEQLVSLHKAFPDDPAVLVLLDGALVAEFGEQAMLLTRTPVDLTPLDFPRIMQKAAGDLAGLKDRLTVIPNEFDGALGRSALVLGGEVVKQAEVTLDGRSLRMVSESGMGDADDSMPFPSDRRAPFYVDPVLLARGAKVCALLGFTDRATIMSDADCRFVHMVAHTTSAKK